MTKKDLCRMGKRIQKARIGKHMTQEELAQEIDRSTPYIGMLERGKRTPGLETFLNIIEVLGVSADSILCDVVTYGYRIRLLKYEEQIVRLSKSDQEKIFRIIEAFLGEG